MSGNFVYCKRERQRIVYIYNIHKVGNLISPDEHMTFDTLISDNFTTHTQ